MEELTSGKKSTIDDRQSFYSELLHFAGQKNYNPNWAKHKYREKFGVWPRGLEEKPLMPSTKTINWIKHKTIAWAKKQQGART